MLRRKLIQAIGAAAVAASLYMPAAFAAQLTTPSFTVELSGDWASQKLPANMAQPGVETYLLASKKAGVGILFNIMKSDMKPKEAIQVMADNLKKQGMRFTMNPIQLPGQDAYQMAYTTRNARMKSTAYVAGNGKRLSNITILGPKQSEALEVLKTLTPKEQGVFPKF